MRSAHPPGTRTPSGPRSRPPALGTDHPDDATREHRFLLPDLLWPAHRQHRDPTCLRARVPWLTTPSSTPRASPSECPMPSPQTPPFSPPFRPTPEPLPAALAPTPSGRGAAHSTAWSTPPIAVARTPNPTGGAASGVPAHGTAPRLRLARPSRRRPRRSAARGAFHRAANAPRVCLTLCVSCFPGTFGRDPAKSPVHCGPLCCSHRRKDAHSTPTARPRRRTPNHPTPATKRDQGLAPKLGCMEFRTHLAW